jgi:hypothetical protein
MRTVIGLAAAGLVVSLALASDARLASATPAADSTRITITYEGTLDTSWEPVMKEPNGRNSHVARYAWVLNWSGTLGDLLRQPTQKLTVAKLNGTVRYTDNVSAEKLSCTGGFTPKVKTITFNASANEQQNALTLSLRVPVSSEFLQPTNTTAREFCSEVVRWAVPGNEMVPFFQFDLSKGGTEGRDVSFGPEGRNRDRAHLDHSATVRVGGSSGGGGNANLKAAARNDLRLSLERAKGPCLHLAISLGVLTSGAVWASVGAPIPGGIPAGGALIATGDLMAAAVVPLCSSAIEQVIIDYTIVKKDPPANLAAPPLKLPSCASRPSALRVYCARLSAALTTLTAAEHRVVLTLGRMQVAAAKLTAARKSGNASRITAATAAARKESAALVSARADARTAGKKVAALVRSVGVRGTLTKAESAAVMDALLARLAKRGVPAADLRALARAPLTPAPVDVLATLAR